MDTVNLSRGVEQAWTGFMTFMPKLLLAVVILVVGYFIAKLLAGLLDKLLERVGFDRLVERGGIKRVLEKTKYDASDLLSKLVFYAIFLFVLEFAFGIFGPNPISAMLTAVIAFLPNLFAAVVIVIVASAIAAAVRDILQATMAGLTYGKTVANIAAIAILATGIFAALNQINIAPAIVNGLFYAMLAIVAGSAIVAIGGGGIVPMRSQWEKALGRMEREAPQLKQRMQEMPQRSEERAEVWKQQATREPGPEKSFPG
ncbi:MAG: mechanosensitive ion channel family protein [Verrucomicrobiota bacterium]